MEDKKEPNAFDVLNELYKEDLENPDSVLNKQIDESIRGSHKLRSFLYFMKTGKLLKPDQK